MAAEGQRRPEQVRQQQEAVSGGRPGPALSLSGQSYWLDLWLFVLFDLALLVVVYLLP